MKEGDQPSAKEAGHYSLHTGHFLRGVHNDVVRRLRGVMPESIAGYDGIEDQRVRRHVRKTHPSGKR